MNIKVMLTVPQKDNSVEEISKPVLLLNIIGTGMYHELQYEQWTTLAKARAIEEES